MSESNPFELGDQMLTMDAHEQVIRNRLGAMDSMNFTERFWKEDGRLWEREETDPAITGTMGWIDIAKTMKERIPELQEFAKEVKEAGFTRAVLAGMGGSSLAPLVLSEILGNEGNGIPVEVLDSTDPETVLRIQRGGPLEKTLFIIASKSGTTAEPTAFDEYFFDQMGRVKQNPGENFAVITDPGSELEKTAKEKGYRRIFLNFENIGGRFSALTYFGLVPAALMGVDLEKLLGRAIKVIDENTGKKASESPAFVLGASIGTLATLAIDKLTFWLPKRLESLGLWLEQLLAESTGKEGKGILPVAGEEPGSPSEYGNDRIFAYLRPNAEDCTNLDIRIFPLRDGGFPIAEIRLNDDYDIATEFMRWELATAVAGSVIGIDPFDQPNVQEAKDVTKQLIAQVEQSGSLAVVKPDAEADGLQFFGLTSSAQGTPSPADRRSVRSAEPVPPSEAREMKRPRNREEGAGGRGSGSGPSPFTLHPSPVTHVGDIVFSFLEEAKLGDFVTLQAYLTESPHMTDALTKLQQHLRDCTRLATTKGYGPRFLHSTGQFHKGGPNKGHFIQLTKDDKEDVPLPGRKYTFGTFRNAQVLGDMETLEKHGRRVIRIHLGADPLSAVLKIVQAVETRPTVELA